MESAPRTVTPRLFSNCPEHTDSCRHRVFRFIHDAVSANSYGRLNYNAQSVPAQAYPGCLLSRFRPRAPVPKQIFSVGNSNSRGEAVSCDSCLGRAFNLNLSARGDASSRPFILADCN